MKTLEGRGELVFRTDLAIFAAVVAAAALVIGRSTPAQLHTATVWALLGSVLFLIPSLCYGALVQSGTSKYSLTKEQTLQTMVREKWDAPEREARFIIASRDVESIGTLRTANQRRAKRLQRAVFFQITFVLLVVVAVVVEAFARIG